MTPLLRVAGLCAAYGDARVLHGVDLEVMRGDFSVLLATRSLDIAERYAIRVVLLLEGRVRRTWHADEMAALRRDPVRSLEQQMADACGA